MSIRLTKRSAAGLLVALAGACADPATAVLEPPLSVPRDIEAAFQTDSLEYTLSHEPWGYDATIGFTFKNPTADSVFVVNCRSLWQFHLEKYEAGGWIPAYQPSLPGCLSPAIIISPLSEAQASVRIIAGYRGTNLYPQFEVESIEGVYRIVWKQVVHSFVMYPTSWGPDIPFEHRISNRFVLTSRLP
jgi:hypothetical protein